MSDVPQTSSDVAGNAKVGAGETAGGVGSAPAAAVAPSSSVGQKLRAARERANMTLAEVAQSLKFSSRQIELLEADDFAGLPGSTAVRGFIRSYAKLLKLDAETLLRMLDEFSPSVPVEVRPPDNMGIASQPGVLQQLSFSATVAIVLLMAAILLGLWHFLGPSSPRPVVAEKRSESPAQPQPAAPPDSSPMTVPAPVAVPVIPPSTDSASATPPAAPVSSQAASADNALNFTFSDRSWVEVIDASKQMLHSGENLAGSRLRVAGRPPFDIVIGNASKVTLTYGERVVDLAPYMRADVARLTLK